MARETTHTQKTQQPVNIQLLKDWWPPCLSLWAAGSEFGGLIYSAFQHHSLISPGSRWPLIASSNISSNKWQQYKLKKKKKERKKEKEKKKEEMEKRPPMP
jgi:hypothetical protein